MNAAYSAASTGLTAQNGTNANEIDMGGSFDGLLLNETLVNFTQVMSSTASASTTTHGATITLDGDPGGKTYSVTIEHSGNNVEIANYVGGTGDNLAKVQTEIITDINAFASANNADIQASAEGGAGVKIVSTVADQPLGVVNSSHSFTNMVSTVQANVNPVAEVDIVTVAGTPAVGDVFTISIGGTDVSVNVTDGSISTLAQVQTALVTAVNGNSGLPVSAAAGTNAGEIELTAKVPGTANPAVTANHFDKVRLDHEADQTLELKVTVTDAASQTLQKSS